MLIFKPGNTVSAFWQIEDRVYVLGIIVTACEYIFVPVCSVPIGNSEKCIGGRQTNEIRGPHPCASIEFFICSPAF